MIKTIYAIFDKKNVSYCQFYITDNEVNLKRTLSYIVSTGNAMNHLFTFTADFALCKVGEIDDKNGNIRNIPAETVCELLSLKGDFNGEQRSEENS